MKYPYLIFYIITFTKTTLFGFSQPEIKQSNAGSIILEYQIDSLWVKDQKIYTKPSLAIDKTPNSFPFPCFKTPLANIPFNASVSITRSDPIPLYLFRPERQGGEKSSDGVTLKEYNKHRFGNFSNEKVGLYPSGHIQDKDVSLLHVNIIEKVNGNWVWYKKITVQIRWQNQKQGQIIFDILSSQNSLNEIENQSSQNFVPDYMISNNLIRIDIESSGYYRIPMDSLSLENSSIQNADSRSFRLWSSGHEQMINIDDELGLMFYGQKASPPDGVDYEYNFYTNTNHYWLTWGNGDGLRYADESVYPALDPSTIQIPHFFNSTIKIENNKHFERLGYSNTHSQWDSFDHYFFSPPISGNASESFLINISNPTGNGQYSVKAMLQGVTNSSRRVNLLLNERVLGSTEWNGRSAQQFEAINLLNEDLIDGQNQLNISVGDLDGLFDRVCLNQIEISYDREYIALNDKLIFKRDGNYSTVSQFTIYGFSSPDIVIFKKGQTRLKNFVTDEMNGSWRIILQDQIVGLSPEYHALSVNNISFPTQIKDVQPLEDIHLEQSNYIVIAPDSFYQELLPLVSHYNAVVISPESIYRTYSDGVLDPYSIRDYLKDAYLNWAVPPEFVLIAQDTAIPAMMMQTEKYGAAFTDYWYSLLTGGDYIPELAIGRLPARTKTEISIMVNKTMQTINNPNQIWENSILMIAGYEDEFRTQAEELIPNIVEKGFFPKRMFIDQYSENGPFWGTTDTLLSFFESGLSYINFFGHGGGAVWGDRSLFTLSDIGDLSNGARTPFVTSMTCFTGDILNPNSLGRKMLGHSNGGAYGWLGSSGLGWIINDYLLLQPIHERLFANNSEPMPIGKLINEAKMDYFFTNIIFPDIAITQLFQFNLMGDPAMVLMRFPAANIDVNNHSVYAGENISFNFDSPSPDSITAQWLDGNNYPLSEIFPIQNEELLIPENVDSGEVSLIGVFKDQYSMNNQFRVSFEIEGSFIQIQNILPDYPIQGDSISFDVYIQDRLGINSVECWVDNYLFCNLEQQSESRYYLEDKIPVPPPGNNVSIKIRVLNSENEETWSSPLEITSLEEIDVRPISILLPDENKIGLIVGLKNQSNGTGTGLMTLQVKWDGELEFQELFSDSMSFSQKLYTTKTIDFPMVSGTHDFMLSFNNVRKFQSDTLYAIDTVITVDRFWITPGLGTTENLMTHDSVKYKDLIYSVSPGKSDGNSIIKFFENGILINENQPSLHPLSISGDSKLIDISVQETIPWSAEWLTGITFGQDTLLFLFNTQRNMWEPVDGDWSGLNYSFNGTGSGQYAWMVSSDQSPPLLEAMIGGQAILRDSYIGAEPDITILAKDENGIEFESPHTKFLKNGREWGIKDDIDINQIGVLTYITFNPMLETDDTSIGFIACDKMGNISDTLTLEFIVSSDIQLFDYGNFPNPFKTITRFAYELTHTVDDFNLIIYSVDGRKIKQFKLGSTLGDFSPNIGGFHEIIWDGRDEWGDEIASGVYFYKYRVKYNSKTFTNIGKVAIAR